MKYINTWEASQLMYVFKHHWDNIFVRDQNNIIQVYVETWPIFHIYAGHSCEVYSTVWILNKEELKWS